MFLNVNCHHSTESLQNVVSEVVILTMIWMDFYHQIPEDLTPFTPYHSATWTPHPPDLVKHLTFKMQFLFLWCLLISLSILSVSWLPLQTSFCLWWLCIPRIDCHLYIPMAPTAFFYDGIHPGGYRAVICLSLSHSVDCGGIWHVLW